MTCESRLLRQVIALRRTQTFAAALLVPAIIIGALGAAVLAVQAQQAVLVAPAGFQNAAPPPKAETPPPAEPFLPSFETFAATCEIFDSQHFSTSITAAFLKFISDNRESTTFTPERKL